MMIIIFIHSKRSNKIKSVSVTVHDKDGVRAVADTEFQIGICDDKDCPAAPFFFLQIQIQISKSGSVCTYDKYQPKPMNGGDLNFKYFSSGNAVIVLQE